MFDFIFFLIKLGFKLADSHILITLLSSFSSNFFSTLLAAIVIYFLLERRFNQKQKENERNRFFKNLIGEMVADYIIAERIVANIPNTTTTDEFPIARFKTSNIHSFTYLQPFEEEKELYLKLQGLALNMEGANSLIDLVFSSKDPKKILGNKDAANSMAIKIKEQMSSLFLELDEINKRYNIMDEIEEPEHTEHTTKTNK